MNTQYQRDGEEEYLTRKQALTDVPANAIIKVIHRCPWCEKHNDGDSAVGAALQLTTGLIIHPLYDSAGNQIRTMECLLGDYQ